MTPPAQRKIIVKNDFAKIFGAYKTQQFVDPPQRGSSGTIHRTIAWNLTGNLIATGATDKTIRIWHPERIASSTTGTNTRNPPPQAELKGHTAEVTKVLFNPVREHELVSTSADATVRFWDTRTKGAATSKLDIGGTGISLAWSVDGTALVAGNRYEVLADISTANPGAPVIIEKHRQTRETNQTTFSNAFPPQDLLITNGDGSVKIVDYPSFETMHTLSSHTSSCSSIALSPTGKYVAVGGSDAMIAIWDTYDWVCKRTFSNANSGKVSGLSWSWDGRYITSSCEDVGSSGGGEGKSEGFEIYHAETGNVVYTVPTKTSPVPAVDWHPSKYALAYTVVENGKSSLKICGLESNP